MNHRASVLLKELVPERSRGELIAARRKQLGLSQEDVESVSGVSKTQISRIERDQVEPTITTIMKLESALNAPLMSLYWHYDAES